MTHLALSEQWTFGGLDLSTFANIVMDRPDSADVMPAFRGQDVPRSGMPGATWLAKPRDVRKVSIALQILSTTASGGTGSGAAQQARVNLDALYAVLALPGQQALVRTMPDATTRQALAQGTVSAVTDGSGNGETLALMVDFLMTDPWWYGATVAPGATTINASPKSLTLTDPGTILTNRLLLDIVGPITNPRVTNSTTNTWVEVDQVVGSGIHLLIDCYAFTALLAGVDVTGSLSHAGDVPYLTVAPGANTLVVTSPSPGGTLTPTLIPAYI